MTGAELRGRLQKLGIYRESGHEHFNGSVVIPIFNLGQVKWCRCTGARSRAGPAARGNAAHLYLPGPHRGVWNEEALAVSKEIILCEALIDALTFWCAGYRHVTTSYGVNGFTDEHRAAFKKYGTKKIYIAYDRDDAGEASGAVARGRTAGDGHRLLTGCSSRRTWTRTNTRSRCSPRRRAWASLLNKAAWLGKGKRPTVAVIEPQITEPKPEPAVEGRKTGNSS